MFTSTSSSSQDFLLSLHNRRLLLQSPTSSQQDQVGRYPAGNGFDANVVMVLSVLLCALICSLGLNSIIRCALRCSTLVSIDSNNGNNNNNNNSNNNSNNNVSSSRLANTGIKRKALKTFPTVSYSPDLKLPGLGTDCVICLSEFAVGEKVRLLPKCNHGFHVRCIDKWLNSHSSCPTCRHCLIETCQKIVGCSTTTTLASSSRTPLPPLPPPPPPPALPQAVVINMGPLQREDMMHNCRGNNS